MNKGFILLNCDLGAEEYIVEELKQMSDVKNAYLRIYFIISENHGNLLAKMESPESNVLWMDANQTVVSGDTISLYFNGIKGIFEGILNKEKDQINGSLRLKGRTISIGLRKK